MKTREEFLAVGKAYQSKAQLHGFVFVLLTPFAFLWPRLLAQALNDSHIYFLENSLAWTSLIVIWIGSIFSFFFFERWYFRKLAANCGLICPECSRVVVGPKKLKLITATHNCPYCGKPFFN